MKNLLLSDNFQTLLDEDSEIDDDLICGSSHLIVLEKDVCSELRDSLINYIFSIEVCLGSGALSLSLKRKDCKAACCRVLGLIIERRVVCYYSCWEL